MILVCQNCKKEFNSSHRQVKCCSRKCSGIQHSKAMQGHRYFGGHQYQKGELHPFWKGDSVGYLGLHRWVYRNLGKAYKCVKCDNKTAKRYEWANLSHQYKRDIYDWTQLCQKCHIEYDKNFRGAKKKRFGG